MLRLLCTVSRTPSALLGRRRWRSALLALSVCPPGLPADLTGDGVVNVVDVQCAVESALAVLAGATEVPACAADNPCAVDIDCSGVVDIADVSLALFLALGLPLPSAVTDAEGCPLGCAGATVGAICPGCAWLEASPCRQWQWSGQACVPVDFDGAPCPGAGPCLLDATCVGGHCEPVLAPECDDCNPCTIVTCDAEGVCAGVPMPKGTPCPTSWCGAAVCMDGWCVAPGETMGVPQCATAPDATGCTLTGEAGEERSCGLWLARWQDTAAVSAMQHVVYYEPEALTLLAIESAKCFDGFGCHYLPASGPGSLPLAFGHSLSVAPTSIAGWSGFGAILTVNLSDPDRAISEARLEGFGWPGCVADAQGEPLLDGAPEVYRLRFRVEQTLTAESPAMVKFAQVGAAVPGVSGYVPTRLFGLGEHALLVTGMGPPQP